MITLTEFETILVTCLPAITSIITVITAVVMAIVKLKKSLDQLKENESLKAERDSLAEQNKILLKEMRKTRKLYQLYIEKAVKVKYDEITEVQDDEELQN